jgi:hypothetical protein
LCVAMIPFSVSFLLSNLLRFCHIPPCHPERSELAPLCGRERSGSPQAKSRTQ